MAWSQIKRSVASRNLTLNLKFVEDETEKEIQNITPSLFKKFTDHALQEEQKYRDLATVSDETTANNCDDTEDESDSDSRSESEYVTDLISLGPTYCHIDGCVQEDRNSAAGHVCDLCKRSIHSICCVRVLNIVREDSDSPLYCSNCYNK